MSYFFIRLLLSYLGPEEVLNMAVNDIIESTGEDLDNDAKYDIVSAFAKHTTAKHLVLAARANDLRLVQILLPHVDKSEFVDIEMKNGAVRSRDASWYAILHGNWPMIDLLLCGNDRIDLIFHIMAHKPTTIAQYLPVLLRNCEAIGGNALERALKRSIEYCNEEAFYKIYNAVNSDYNAVNSDYTASISSIIEKYIKNEEYVTRLRAYERMLEFHKQSSDSSLMSSRVQHLEDLQ